MNKTVKKEVESACEYILPDYMGDIKKILYSRARCMPVGKYVSGADAEHNGVVEYEVLYADADNRLTAVTASSDYTVSASMSGADLADSYHRGRVSGFTARTTGPRKLSFKSVVSADVLLVPETDGLEGLSPANKEADFEVRTSQIKTEVYAHVATAEREIAEEVGRLSGISKDDVEPILVTGDVRITDVRAFDGGVCIKGEVIAEIIRRVADAPPYSTKKAYPFEHTAEAETVPDAKLTASGALGSITVGMSEEGEDTVLSVSAIVELDIYASYNEERSVAVDAYSTESETEAQYGEYGYSTLLDVATAEFHLDEKVAKDALGLGTVRDILITRADAVLSACEAERHGAKISGDILLSGVACEINADDDIVYTLFKHSFPFSYNVNINCQTSVPDSLECELLPVVADVAIDSDGIYFKITVSATVKARSAGNIRYLCACNITDGEIYRPSRSRITVYYPSRGETLFDIAKKHHTTCEKLCLDNSISSEVFSATGSALPKKLIIK